MRFFNLVLITKGKENFSLGDLKPKNIEALTEFLERVKKKRSTNTVYDIYCETDGENETRNILNKFNYVNTSYVIMPVEGAKHFYRKYVPSPLDLVAECLDLEDDWRYSDDY